MLRKVIKENVENVGACLRLSDEDLRNGGIDTSISIENQQKRIEEYCRERGWNIHDFYIDDGISGTIFNDKREGFTRLMADVRAGIIDCVIITDLARLGRIAYKSGSIRRELQHSGVRYIAITDGFDNIREAKRRGMNVDVHIREMFNEFYPAQVSQKVREVKKMHARNGYFANSRPAYGYLKQSDIMLNGDKHKLVIDNDVKQNAVRIFDLFISGMSGRAIANLFNQEGIPSPQKHYYDRRSKENPNKNQSNLWSEGSVMTIIKNHVYYGAIVNCRREVRDYDDKTIDRLPENEWIIVEDMHEPIITKERWLQAQEITERNRKNVRKPKKDGEHDIFSGVLKCGDCGGNMARKFRQNKTCPDVVLYRCSAWVQKSKCACTSHEIKFDVISQVVLRDIQKYAVLAEQDEEKLLAKLRDESDDFKAQTLKQLETVIKDCRKRLEQIDKIIQTAYEDRVNGVITVERFTQMSQGFEREQAELNNRLTERGHEYDQNRQTEKDITSWVAKVKKCLSITDLTRPVIMGLIDRIEVSEAYSENGVKTFDINIQYKFGATKGKD